MTKKNLFKIARLVLILAAALTIVAPVLAQGTTPGGGQSTSGNSGAGTLNGGTANINFPAGACLGSCSVTPNLDPFALNSPIPGGGTILGGFNLQISPTTFGVPLLTLDFPAPAPIVLGANGQVTNPVIMNFDTSLNPPRWVSLPTFFDPVTGRLYTTVRLLGNFALVRQ